MDYHIILKPPPEKPPGMDRYVWGEMQNRFSCQVAQLQQAFCTIDYNPLRPEHWDSTASGNTSQAYAISGFGFEQFNEVPDAVCVLLRRQLDLPKDARIHLLSISPVKPFVGVALGRLQSIAEKFEDIILRIDPPFETILQCRQKVAVPAEPAATKPAATKPAQSRPIPISRGVPQDGPLPMSLAVPQEPPVAAAPRVKATRIPHDRARAI